MEEMESNVTKENEVKNEKTELSSEKSNDNKMENNKTLNRQTSSSNNRNRSNFTERRNTRNTRNMGNRNRRQMYGRKKVSRLYKLLGSSKKLWNEKIDYKNIDLLRNFITDAGKITPRRTTGVSPIFHRKIVREIKKARSIALLPFKVRD